MQSVDASPAAELVPEPEQAAGSPPVVLAGAPERALALVPEPDAAQPQPG